MAFPGGDLTSEPPLTRAQVAATRVRYRVLALLCLLIFILYLALASRGFYHLGMSERPPATGVVVGSGDGDQR
jgi:hypothetical protein